MPEAKPSDFTTPLHDRLSHADYVKQQLSLARNFVQLGNIPEPEGCPIKVMYSSLKLQRARRDDERGQNARQAPDMLNNAVLEVIRENETEILAAAVARIRSNYDEALGEADLSLNEVREYFQSLDLSGTRTGRTGGAAGPDSDERSPLLR